MPLSVGFVVQIQAKQTRRPHRDGYCNPLKSQTLYVPPRRLDWSLWRTAESIAAGFMFSGTDHKYSCHFMLCSEHFIWCLQQLGVSSQEWINTAWSKPNSGNIPPWNSQVTAWFQKVFRPHLGSRKIIIAKILSSFHCGPLPVEGLTDQTTHTAPSYFISFFPKAKAISLVSYFYSAVVILHL